MSDRYDPQALEDSPGKSDYFSRKDAKWVILLFVVGGIAAVPIYRWGIEEKNKTLCRTNIKALGDAMNLYAENNDDRYPPLFESDASGSPDVANGKIPVTWASVTGQYHNGRSDLRCPAADDEENAQTQWKGHTHPISYGMYVDHATVIRSNIEQPDDTILIAETSSLGTKGSFDPTPYKDPSGNPIPDAFAIGWDNSNEAPNSKTTMVTRLAFRKTNEGRFDAETTSRHAIGIHAVTVSGRLVVLQPDSSRTNWDVSTLKGAWRTQP